MGEWDCYCMLCCGPLQMSSVSVGDMAPKALRKRDKGVRQEAREAKGLDGAPGGDEMEDSDESDSETETKVHKSGTILRKLRPDFDGQSELYHGIPDGDQLYSHYEGYSYDPRILTGEDIAWLKQCRTLGFNADTRKAYITGLGQYAGLGDFETSEGGNDPMDPYRGQERCYPCYLEDGGELDDPTYPFHEACYAILAKCLGFGNIASIDKDIMYKTVCILGENGGCCLTVDYGVEGGEQFWSNRPGEEYLVICPADAGLELRESLWKRMPPRLLLTEPQPDLACRVQHDPLTALPFDLLHTIIQYLPVQDALSLMQASYHVCITTREPTFWRSMIRTHLAPWFWEIETLVTGDELQGLDYKGLFLWLDKVTEPICAMQGPFMGVANRRRIWSVCGVVADAYKMQLEQGQETHAES